MTVARMSLRERLASGDFAVTAEISPPRGAGTDPVTKVALLLRDWVDAVNVTDNQGSNARMASWAAGLAVLHNQWTNAPSSINGKGRNHGEIHLGTCSPPLARP